MILIAKSKYNTVWPGISPLSSRGALKGKLSPTQILDAITLEFLLQVKHETHFHILWKSQKKSLIQHCERSELRLHFEWTKVHKKCQKWLVSKVLKLAAKQCYQTSILLGQKLVENSKMQMRHFEWFSNIVPMCQIGPISFEDRHVCTPHKAQTTRFHELFSHAMHRKMEKFLKR